jgi:predicted naringenin-chalcone synthase
VRAGEKSGIKKRYFHYTEETLAGRPEFLDPAVPSLDARLAIVAEAVPELAAAAAARAIAEWGRSAADITHLVLSTNSDASLPAADLRLAELLGLRPTVQRTVLYLHGCFGGCSALRVARDLAENNRGARVLVAVSELSTMLSFRAPVEARPEALVVSALFGDGAGAVIVGAGPMDTVERPIFYTASAAQATLAGTERTMFMQLGNAGYDVGLSANAPTLVRDNIERCVSDVMASLGLAVDGSGGGWNSLFWAVHPGGRAILDSCEAALALEPGKLAASRHVLSEYGNMLGATIIFVLDEIRRRRRQADVDHNEADVLGCEWGLTLGIGPGVTIEMMLLRAAGENQH